jgi:poly-gamma-glutamate capsule biosynthesis protein CapA/YwtB (metallophosphatase superfamily)
MSHDPARPARPGMLAGACAVLLAAATVACGGSDGRHPAAPHVPAVEAQQHEADDGASADPSGPRGTVTLAFAGDTHFQLNLASLLDHPRGALGPVARSLGAADLTMVNLESAIALGGTRDPKELEVPSDRFWYRTSPRALQVLAAAGVDVVTMANNHGVDYGPAGLAETLRARRDGPLAVVGVGRNRRDAFSPYRVTIRGTDIAVLAADASPREGMSPTWAAGATTAGLAAAHSSRPTALLRAVRVAARASDVMVVYLHWGTEERSCPDHRQPALARALAEAGADVVVGSHAHVLLGSGWLGRTYVDYGLGNFLWYHDGHPETGVLRLTIRDGKVVADSFRPARIQTYGRPLPLRGDERDDAIESWRRLRSCTGLTAHRREQIRAPYDWSVRRIGPALERRMLWSHHRGCPVPLAELRYLRMDYVGFDGSSHSGEMVVHEDYAEGIARVFGRLYDAGWPIRRMRLVDDYGGDDRRSMGADNTSGFNCRRVAGSRSWSAHAFGAAVDLNPVQNPDLSGPYVAPQVGRRYAGTNRSTEGQAPFGVVTAEGLVVRAFARIGWSWGGTWSSGKDYQHFWADDGRGVRMVTGG